MPTPGEGPAEGLRRLVSGLDDERLGPVAAELFQVAGLLDREPGLRRALSDNDVSVAARRGLLDDLLGGHLAADTLEVLAEAAVVPRTAAAELSDGVVDAAAEAAMALAERRGGLDRLIDELLAVAEVLDGSPSLHWALRESARDPRAARTLVDDVFGGRLEAATLAVLDGAVEARRAGRLAEVAREMAGRGAARDGRVLAEVRTAVPLDEPRRRRLAEALHRATGKRVEPRFAVDPSVVGSVWVKVGDEVIDGTVRRQLAAAEASLSAGD